MIIGIDRACRSRRPPRPWDYSSETVSKWSQRERYEQRAPALRGSQLDPYKSQIVRWLEAHQFSAQQILQRLREIGYRGGLTIVKTYVRRVRPPKQKAYLKLTFAKGECAQVDWGQHGSIGVGSTRRRLSFFVMVHCYSRQMYVEFTVSQTMEHFLGCHERAFAVLGVPTKIMVDNLKSAVLRRLAGVARAGVRSALCRLCAPSGLSDRGHVTGRGK